VVPGRTDSALTRKDSDVPSVSDRDAEGDPDIDGDADADADEDADDADGEPDVSNLGRIGPVAGWMKREEGVEVGS